MYPSHVFEKRFAFKMKRLKDLLCANGYFRLIKEWCSYTIHIIIKERTNDDTICTTIILLIHMSFIWPKIKLIINHVYDCWYINVSCLPKHPTVHKVENLIQGRVYTSNECNIPDTSAIVIIAIHQCSLSKCFPVLTYSQTKW